MSEQIVTTYDLKVQESQRLWASYGGVPPWTKRQVETLPTEYPRDTFDEQTLVDQVVEQAKAVLHSIDAATRRRVMTKALQRLEADA